MLSLLTNLTSMSDGYCASRNGGEMWQASVRAVVPPTIARLAGIATRLIGRVAIARDPLWLGIVTASRRHIRASRK